MPEPEPYQFSTFIGSLCFKRDTDVLKLGAKLGIDPAELLKMINGKVVPTDQTRPFSGTDRFRGRTVFGDGPFSGTDGTITNPSGE